MTTSADLRTRLLAHCLEMAKTQPAYAVDSAKRYEAMTDGMLAGLVGRVSAAVRRGRE
jgi:hypothetical protein